MMDVDSEKGSMVFGIRCQGLYTSVKNILEATLQSHQPNTCFHLLSVM